MPLCSTKAENVLTNSLGYFRRRIHHYAAGLYKLKSRITGESIIMVIKNWILKSDSRIQISFLPLTATELGKSQTMSLSFSICK